MLEQNESNKETGSISDYSLFLGDIELLKSLAETFQFKNPFFYTDLSNKEQLRSTINNSCFLIIIATENIESLSNCFIEIFGRRCNTTPVVFFTFSGSDNLKKILNSKERFSDFEKCLCGGLILCIKLPLEEKLADTKTKIEDFIKNYSKREAAASEVWEAISKNIAVLSDVIHRHTMGNLMAASRLLNGAIRSGDYNLLEPEMEGYAIQIHDELVECGCDENGNMWGNKEKEEKKVSFKKFIEDVKNKQQAQSSFKYNVWHEKFKNILVIDDEKHIWEPVWKFIFGKDKIICMDKWDKDTFENNYNQKHYDFVILDINFGEKAGYNGIDILQEIKAKHLDLPVIMTTACDHAELTKKCLQLGAQNYFIKELAEKERDSTRYYEAFKLMISEIFPYESEERKIWREFVEIEPKINAIDKELFTRIGHFFRRAYYLFTLNDKHLLPLKLLIPEWLVGNQKGDTRWDGVAFNAVEAVDECCMALYLCKNGGKFDDVRDTIFKNTDIGPPNLEQRMKYAGFWDKEFGLSIRYLKKASDARHAFRTGEESLSNRDKAKGCLCELLKIMNELIKRVNKIIGDKLGPIPTVVKKRSIEVNRYLNIRKSESTHESRSRKSAEILKNGFNEWKKNTPTSKKHRKKVLFVDDEGKASPLYGVLKEIFDFKGCTLDVAQTLDDFASPVINTEHPTVKSDQSTPYKLKNSYDLILLDLMFKDNGKEDLTPKGIDYLISLKENEISTPFLIFTADNSSYFARKCIFLGADGYFVKETLYKPLDYYKMFSELVDRYLDENNDNRLRTLWWQIIKNLNNKNFGLADDDVRWEKIKEFKNKKGTKNAEVLKLLQQLIRFPLREAYFYFFLYKFPEIFIDLWKVERLLGSGYHLVDILLSLRQLVEFLVRQLYEVREGKTARDIKIGNEIKFLKYPNKEHIKLLKEIWEIGTDAKMGKTITINLDNILDRLNKCLKDFVLC